MSDQKKPPVPSFEELQAQQRARDATVKGPAPAAPPGQLDPRLTKTTPASPNPVLLNQTKPPASTRLDPDMLSRLATGGLAAGGYPKGNLEPTQMGPMPKPPAPEERTHIQRTPTVPPAPGIPRVGTPAGQPSSAPVSRPPSIPAAPASLSARPPVPQGPPPKMPAPPPPGAAAAPRPPTQPPMPAAPVRAPTNPPMPAAAPRAPSVAPPAYAPRAPAPPNPPVSNTPIPGSTVSTRQASNIPPPPSHSPTLSRHPPTTGPQPIPTAPEPKPLGESSGYSATYLRPVTEPPTGRVPSVNVPTAPKAPVAPSPQPPSEVAANPTHKVNRAELQEMFADLPTTPRVPVPQPAAPPKPQPKLDAPRPDSSSRAALNEAVDDRTPVHSAKPEQVPAHRPIASGFADPASVPMPHLDRPPALNSRSLLDVSPVISAPAVEAPPMKRSETVNLRSPSKDELKAVQPRPSATPPRPPPPSALVEIPPEERTPIKVNAAFATTQPGVPGPFMKKSSRAAEFVVTPVEADAQPEHELAPTTEAGGLSPVTINQSGPSALGEAYDPSARSDEVPALETQMRPVKGELVAAPASLVRRCFSFLVDFVLVGGLCVGLLMAASVVKGVKAVPPHLSDLDIVLYRAHALDKLLIPSLALCVLVVLVYTTVFASGLKGRTPGRLLTGVRLVTSKGETPGLARSLLRAVFSFVSFGLCLGGFWLALFDRKGQTLHDKLTRTFVVRPL